MSKTGPEIRHDAKERMKRYRAEMIDKGYTSTTVFLSQEHRAELKRLGEEHRLTRAEAAEHIFKVYLKSENKDITETHNINTENQTETIATIEDLKARLKALEEKHSKQTKVIEDLVSAVEEVHLQDNLNNKHETQTDNTNNEYQVKPPDTMPDAKVKEGQDKDQTPVVEPSDAISNKDATQTNNTNSKIAAEVPATQDIKPISETQTEIPAPIPGPKPKTESGADIQEQGQPIKSKQGQNMELPDYLVDVNPDMPIKERHKIILRLSEDFPGRAKGIPQKRIDMLNAAGILLNGKSWKTTKQFADQLSIARRWSKKQVKKS